MQTKVTPLSAMISSLAGDLKTAVDHIERDTIKTTRDHYGRYLAIISTLARGDKRMAKIIVAALLEAGANHAGVAAAYRVSFGG